MDTVKSAILIACVFGIIGVIFDFAIPEGRIKNQFDFILGLVIVLAIISPFTQKGFVFSDFDFKEKFDENRINNKISEEKSQIIEEYSQKKTEEYFLDKLNKNGIKVEEIKANLEINKNSEIEITEISVKGEFENEDEKEKIKSLINDELKDVLVKFVGDDEENETSHKMQ